MCWRAIMLGAIFSPSVATLDPRRVPCPMTIGRCLGGEDHVYDNTEEWAGNLEPTLDYIRQLLQTCVEIEHSTIPLYLTACYSMRNTSTWEHGIIQGIAIEEMLHMTNVANVLNAIGGAPSIDSPSFIPTFPIDIPVINITAGVRPFGRDATNTFEQIETTYETTKTITATYSYIARMLVDLTIKYGEKAVFSGDPALQVSVSTHGGESSRVITGLASAVSALHGVSDQGSGCPAADPFGFNISAGPLGGGVAHWARFKEVLVGREFLPNDTAATGPTGPTHSIDWGGASYTFESNPRVEDFPEGSDAHALALAFASNYTMLLVKLHAVFNGSPQTFSQTLSVMYKLRQMAVQMMNTHDPRLPSNMSVGIGMLHVAAVLLCVQYASRCAC